MHIRKLFGVFEVFCSVFLRYFDLCFRGYSYIITANLRHNLLISPDGLERLNLRHNRLISPNRLERLILRHNRLISPNRLERLILRHNRLISPNRLERLIASDFSAQKSQIILFIFGHIKKKQYLCVNKLTPLPVDQRA